MNKMFIIINIYFISSIIDLIEVTSASYAGLIKLIPLSLYIWSITPVELWWYDIPSLVLLSSIFYSLILVIDSVSVSFCKVKSSFDKCSVWTLIRREVWISYNNITVVCILIIWFATIDMWGNSITSPLIRLQWKLPQLISSWWGKHHDCLC